MQACYVAARITMLRKLLAKCLVCTVDNRLQNQSRCLTCRLVASTTRVDVLKAACSDCSAQAGSDVPLAVEADVLPFVSDDSRLQVHDRRH